MYSFEQEMLLTLAYGPTYYVCYGGIIRRCNHCNACCRNLIDEFTHDDMCLHKRAKDRAVELRLTKDDYENLALHVGITSFHEVEIIDSEVVFMAKLSDTQTLFVKHIAMQNAIRHQGAYENQVMYINYWVAALQVKNYNVFEDRNNPSFWIESN